jgi:hypothetical protein
MPNLSKAVISHFQSETIDAVLAVPQGAFIREIYMP